MSQSPETYHVYAGVPLVSENECICMHVLFLESRPRSTWNINEKIVIASNENDVIPIHEPDPFSLFISLYVCIRAREIFVLMRGHVRLDQRI